MENEGFDEMRKRRSRAWGYGREWVDDGFACKKPVKNGYKAMTSSRMTMLSRSHGTIQTYRHRMIPSCNLFSSPLAS